jgi:hypothetical protein
VDSGESSRSGTPPPADEPTDGHRQRGFTPEDGRLLCIVEAARREDVLRLFEIALLPSAQVLDVVIIELHPRDA